MAVRILNYFSVDVSRYGTPTYVTFMPGQIVEDEGLAERLLSQKCPVVDVEDREIVSCPKCRSFASWKTNKKTVTITCANASVTVNSQFFSFRLGDIVSHPWLVEALQKNSVPLDQIEVVECPTCKFVWY